MSEADSGEKTELATEKRMKEGVCSPFGMTFLGATAAVLRTNKPSKVGNCVLKKLFRPILQKQLFFWREKGEKVKTFF